METPETSTKIRMIDELGIAVVQWLAKNGMRRQEMSADQAARVVATLLFIAGAEAVRTNAPAIDEEEFLYLARQAYQRALREAGIEWPGN